MKSMTHPKQIFKHDIYQKFHYLHSQDIYPLPADIAQSIEQLYELITCLMNAKDKNV